MNPYVSWAIVLVVAGGLGYYYSTTSKPKSRAPIRAVPEKVEAPLPAPKPKKQKNRKQQPESAPAAASKSSSSSTLIDTTNDEASEDIDTTEFAKRLAAARSGVSVGETKPKARKEKRAKTQAPAPAQESTGSELSTRAPSSNGADADDDLSSTDIVSPSFNNVSDMLEQPAPGPSILRLTGSFETKEKKSKAQTFKPVETKKQRQNRQKNESRKQANQEAETERRKLLEKQLHAAREAERRESAGRKQSATPATSNAWTSNANGTQAAKAPAPAVNTTLPLLDTFEPTTSQAASSSTWANLPPEEEQMRILGVAVPEVDEDWTTVSSKKVKAKKKATKAEESANETSASETSPTITEPQVTEWVAPKVTAVAVPRGKNHPLDSDWAA
jgi:hypothetical protein